ncbi:MAG: AbrB family transcriptional regulator [Desulfobulbaceae bacterium]|nr:AbrB family transcriptional regulator [Desulfobulbaceae bacterium]
MERYFLVIAAGIAGGFIALRFSIPGGAVVGSMLGAGIMSLLLPNGVTLSPNAAVGVQILLGISLGMTFDRTFLSLGARVLPLAIISTLILLAVTICMALLASRLGLMDFGTALFGFSPGGMSGMSILAKTEGHNPPVVAFLHMVRIFTLFIMVPLLARLFLYLKSHLSL